MDRTLAEMMVRSKARSQMNLEEKKRIWYLPEDSLEEEGV